jgi:hypothetical protein
MSKALEYKLPSDDASLDSDGDGLLDRWETSGYDADRDGISDVDLPGLGADRLRRDIFLELDIMTGVINRPDLGVGGVADSTVFDGLKSMFESAPIINVAGAPGIHLVVDATGTACLPHPPGPDVCSFEFTIFDDDNLPSGTVIPDPFTSGTVQFSKLKDASFENRQRGSIYHYAIWGIQVHGGPSSGISDYGDDFLISFDKYDPSYQTRRSQIEALAHELGHDLGQRHGGTGNFPRYKPNYLSIMSYSWLHRTGWTDAERLKRVTCLPAYYADASAREMGGAVPGMVNTIVSYSEGMARPLSRPTGTDPGSPFYCGLTIDWTTIPTLFNKVEDFPNWPKLTFDGPVKNGDLRP